MKFRKLGAALSGVALMAALAACSDQSPIAPEGNDGGSEGAKELKSVGLMVQDVSNPFFAVMKTQMEELGAEQGFSVNVQDGQQDLGQQNNQIDAFIQQKTDLILINAVDSEGIGSAVQRALDAGVVVVAVDADAAGTQAVVMTDNVEAGRQSCTALAEKIGGKGNIIVIDGTPITPVIDRVNGCEEALENFPDVKIVGKQAGKNDVASGQTIATDLLTANPDLQGIFGLNDPTARGAVLALQQANRTGIWVTGVDGSPEAVVEMQTEGSPFWASPAQDPKGMVVQAFEVGKEIFLTGNAPAERVTLLKPSLVTQDDVSEYGGW